MLVLADAGTVVSAVAAVGAVWFAYQTVQQTRDLRREDRRARIAELAGDFAASLLRVLQGAGHERISTLPVARARLAAAIASAGERLPACEGLLALDDKASYEQVQRDRSLT
jgi:hypothetical protein